MKPKIMGILNVTPDSFYDGGKFIDFEVAIARGVQMYKEGADILDIGGESTRPNAEEVPEIEEIERVIEVIRTLKKEIPIPLSIDTTKSNVAAAALNEGASFINDVSGFSDPNMVALARESGVPICVMHRRGTPKTMQSNLFYENGIVSHLTSWFLNRTMQLLRAGIKKENIILDPGIGFGKTIEDNLKILQNLPKFKTIGFSMLIGLSRKSFMNKVLHKTAAETLPATLTMNTVAALLGADILRVHDVPEHRQLADMLEKYNSVSLEIRT